MNQIRVLSIFGTRPEAIKMAPVVLELQKHPDKIRSIVAVTAQHREMLDQVLHLFKIVPDHDLDIMSPSQTLFDITGRALNGLNEAIASPVRTSCWFMETRRLLLWERLRHFITRSRSVMWRPGCGLITNILPIPKK